MDENFDKKLREMARNSNVKEPWDIKEIAKTVCENNKKKSKLLNYKRAIVAASIMLICTISLGVFGKISAKEIPFVNGVLEYFTRNNKVDKGYGNNSIGEDYAINNENYNIYIENVYYDGGKLVFFYKINSKEPLDRTKEYYLNTELNINADIKGMGGLEQKDFVDDYTYAGMIGYGIESSSRDTWPEKLEGYIKINSIDIYGKGNDVKSVAVEAEPLKISLDSNSVPKKELDINKNISKDGLTTEISKLIKSPTGITLEMINSSYSVDNGIYFMTYLWDSEKGILKWQGKTNDENEKGIIIREEYENPSKNGTLSIITFASNSGPIGYGNDRKKQYSLKEGIDLDLLDLGNLKVEKIEDKDDKTLITMDLKGYIATKQDLQIFNGSNKYMPMEIINKEVKGDLEIKATYVYPKLSLSDDIVISLFHPKYLELLTDQTIKINLDELK